MLALVMLLAAVPWPDAVARVGRDLSSSERATRLEAAHELACLDHPEALRRLRELLRDGDTAVKFVAMRALARRGEPAALDMATAAIREGAPAERAAALEALRLAPSLAPPARAALERTLHDGDPAIRLTALDVLDEKDAGPSFALVAALLEDPTPAVRLRAVRALAATRDGRAAPLLLARLGDADRQVQRESVRALGRLGEPGATAALLRLLEAGSDDVRVDVIEALAGLRAENAVAALADLAARRPADLVARRAQRALGEIATAEAWEALCELLGTGSASADVEEALLRGGGAVVPRLLALLEREPGAGAEIARLLGRLGDRRATAPLRALLRRREQATIAAATALGQLGAREAVADLVLLARDPALGVRRAALRALAAIGDDRAVTALGPALEDEDPGVRVEALALAAAIHARTEAAAVARRLADPQPEVRREAVRALAAVNARESGRALVEALPGLAGLEGAAAAALAQLARPEDLPWLVARAESAGDEQRSVLIAGVAAALAAARFSDDGTGRRAVAALVAELARPGATGEVAAHTLAGLAPAPSGLAADLLERWPALPAHARATLAATVGKAPGGAAFLREVVARGADSDEALAAAAWALSTDGEPATRRALDAAARALHPGAAANAKAALERLARGTKGSRALDVVIASPDGGRAANVWIQVTTADRLRVWARTGAGGRVRVPELGDAPVDVAAADPELGLERAGDGVGQIARHDVPAP